MSGRKPSIDYPQLTDRINKLAPYSIVGALVLLFWYFIGTPLHLIANVLGAALLVLLMALAIYIAVAGKQAEPWFRYQLGIIIIVAICIPVYSTIRAGLNFGQPFLFGALAERHWWGIVFGPIIYYLLTSGRMSEQALESALLTLSWLSITLFAMVVFFFLAYEDLGTNLFEISAISNTEGRGLRAQFPLYSIIFGALYYLAAARNRNTFFSLMTSGLFIFYVVFIARGRVDIVSLGLVLMYALYSSGLYRRWKPLISVFVIYTTLAATSPLSDINAGTIHGSLVESTVRDLAKIATADEAREPGLNARANSFSIITEELTGSPALLLGGAGKISNRWEGGFSGAIGAWFYPAELGFIGAVYVYGLVIFLTLSTYALYLSVRAIRSTAYAESTIIVTMRWMMVFILIQFVTGMPLLSPTPIYFTVFACMALSRPSQRAKTSKPVFTAEG